VETLSDPGAAVLEELRIRSLGVIDEAVLELGPGLCVITGETGAGKTMVVSALGLLLGGRADPGLVGAGTRAARVEGVVHLDHEADAVAARAEGLGGEVEDGCLLLARTIAAEGRSRAFAGGAAVPATALASMAQTLVAVHGQSDQHRLLRPDAQRDALDAFAGDRALVVRARCAAAFRELRETEAELSEVTASRRERAREAAMLRFGVDEVAAATPEPGEDVALATEEARLGFADTLRAAAESAKESLTSEDDAADALTAVSVARKLLDGVCDHDTEVAGLAERLAEVSYLLSDLAADVASYAAGLESDPARLAVVSERRAVLIGLQRKYGESIDEVLAWAQSSTGRLLELDQTDDRIDALRSRAEELREELTTAGDALSEVRDAAAAELSRIVSDELAALAMPHARLEVAVTRRSEPAVHGFDDVELRLAGDRGATLRPLGRCASGGELSRVMLGLEVALAATNPVPTLVFDEVDAGVGGKAAVEVGRRLAGLARHAQVVVVTHLPQVAAFADQHHVVLKSSDGAVTRSGVRRLDDTGRVKELSRMLAGMEDSGTAIAHARELLENARTEAAKADSRTTR
jgi:DNA repair protein RecN (Recombination protein N)